MWLHEDRGMEPGITNYRQKHDFLKENRQKRQRVNDDLKQMSASKLLQFCQIFRHLLQDKAKKFDTTLTFMKKKNNIFQRSPDAQTALAEFTDGLSNAVLLTLTTENQSLVQDRDRINVRLANILYQNQNWSSRKVLRWLYFVFKQLN